MAAFRPLANVSDTELRILRVLTAGVAWAQLVLSFYEARKQPWVLGFGSQEERLFWEQWWAPGPSHLQHEPAFARTLTRPPALVSGCPDAHYESWAGGGWRLLGLPPELPP